MNQKECIGATRNLSLAVLSVITVTAPFINVVDLPKHVMIMTSVEAALLLLVVLLSKAVFNKKLLFTIFLGSHAIVYAGEDSIFRKYCDAAEVLPTLAQVPSITGSPQYEEMENNVAKESPSEQYSENSSDEDVPYITHMVEEAVKKDYAGFLRMIKNVSMNQKIKGVESSQDGNGDSLNEDAIYKLKKTTRLGYVLYLALKTKENEIRQAQEAAGLPFDESLIDPYLEEMERCFVGDLNDDESDSSDENDENKEKNEKNDENPMTLPPQENENSLCPVENETISPSVENESTLSPKENETSLPPLDEALIEPDITVLKINGEAQESSNPTITS